MAHAGTFRGRAAGRRQLRDLQDEINERRTLDEIRREKSDQDRRAWIRPAVVSSAITLVVTGIAVWGTWSAARFGADEDREKEARERRATIYAEYLQAARASWADIVAAESMEKVVSLDERQLEASPATGSPAQRNAAQARLDVARAKLSETYGQQAKDEAAFSKQADLVYVYGSDNAWVSHLRVKAALTAEAQNKTDGRPVTAGFAQFQQVFCVEASAKPRDGCVT